MGVLPDFFLYAGGIAAFAVAFGMGANNVSNAIGTSVGSGAISIRSGLILAGIFEFLGTILMGGMVTETLKSSIISPTAFEGHIELFAIGMFATMITAVIWILIATHYALPISATQTIIGGIVGFSVVEHKLGFVNQTTLTVIVLSWFLSPVIGAVLASALYYSIYKLTLEKGECSKFVVPVYYGGTFTILIGFTLQSNQHVLKLSQDILIFIIVAIFFITFLLSLWMRSKPTIILPIQSLGVANTFKEDPENVDSGREQKEASEAPFKFLMVLSAAFVAFAHGSNDVSNASGPFATLVELFQTGTISPDTSVPMFVIVSCGVGIVLGLFILGYKTLETVGEKITKLTFTKGFAAQLSGATTILLASSLSLPISTTAILVGGIVGVGLVGDDTGNAVDKQVLLKIVSGWVLTVLVGLIGTPIAYSILKLLV